MATDRPITIIDGSTDWSAGVNSLKVTTMQSEQNPNGLARNELAWMNNATVRGGGVMQRTTWQPRLTVHDSSGFWQGWKTYTPDTGNPYYIAVISGSVYQLDPVSGTVTNLSAAFATGLDAMTLPATTDCFFCQGEQFMVIQAGDNLTLPLIWDGVTLRRSRGITNTAVAPGTPGVNEIPAATAMDYYMGRLWYAQGRSYSAGDIVGGNSGTAIHNFRDAILNVTENPLATGGDGFRVPTTDGTIRCLTHNANLDTALGQGQLIIFTRKAVYALSVPVTRTDWIAAGTNNQPMQRVIQLVNGSVNDRSVVAVNGDLFYQSLEPSIRSLFMSVRYFQQWGNISISSNLYRLLRFNDRSLLHHASGIYFDNRLLQTGLPKDTPQGVVHQCLAVMDFVPLSTLSQQLPPVWEGVWDGLDIFQLAVGDYGGFERAYAAVRSRVDSSIQIWELTDAEKFENGDNRVTWGFETPAHTFNDSFKLKKTVTAEFWIDKIFGEVIFKVEYRVDSDPCWREWYEWKECVARNSCEDIVNPVCYPQKEYCESFHSTAKLPLPPKVCQLISGRPYNIAYQFQLRVTVKGWARVRGILLHAEPVVEKLYEGMVC